MKPGDLVRWTYPGAEDIGIVLAYAAAPWMGDMINIYWTKNPKHSGEYDRKHRYLELAQEIPVKSGT